jgi:hypothetical protein
VLSPCGPPRTSGADSPRPVEDVFDSLMGRL